jgi:hypothetical protein
MKSFNDTLRWFMPGQIAKYPGISRRESIVLNYWIKKTKLNITRISYGAPLLPSASNPICSEAYLVKNWTFLSALKFDFYAETPEFNIIGEIKIHARPQAIYQVLSYINLFSYYYPDLPRPKAMIVCFSASNTTRDLAKNNNIDIVVCGFGKGLIFQGFYHRSLPLINAMNDIFSQHLTADPKTNCRKQSEGSRRPLPSASVRLSAPRATPVADVALSPVYVPPVVVGESSAAGAVEGQTSPELQKQVATSSDASPEGNRRPTEEIVVAS